jgi:hypothetical protein
MTKFYEGRAWFWIGALALLIAVAFLLIPHSGSAHATDWLAILPICFVGVISPLCVLGAETCPGNGIIPNAPPLPALFQRPLPSHCN